MSQLDQDWQVVKQELVDLKAERDALRSDNSVLVAQVKDLEAKVPSDQTASELRAEADSVTNPKA